MSIPVKPAVPELRRNIFVRDPLRKITHKLKLFNEKTPFGEIPSMWLQHIEPRISRNWGLHRNCWWWEGPHHYDSGEPQFYLIEEIRNEFGKVVGKNRKQVTAKLFVADMFINAHDVPSYDVVHLCGNKSCINPHHFQVRLDHPNQRSEEEMLRERRDLLSEWDYYRP